MEIMSTTTAQQFQVTGQFQRFWGASGDFWHTKWNSFLDVTGDDPVTLWITGTLIFTFMVYWIFGAIYTIMDITNKPKFLRKYKIQPGTNEPVDNRKLKMVILQVLFNQLIVGALFSIISYQLLCLRGLSSVRQLPTFHRLIFELLMCIVIEEIGFYYSHRLLHSKHLYKLIHKKHHEWTSPIAITSIYCHPIEHIFSNLLPPFLGVLILGCNISTAWIWFAMAYLSTLNSHSGYHLPFFPSPEAHDFHHLKFNNCFGILGILDHWHGTDTLFRQTEAFKRHIMMLSFKPLRETYPDMKNHKDY